MIKEKDIKHHAIDVLNCSEENNFLEHKTKLAKALYKELSVPTINEISTVSRERETATYPPNCLSKSFLLSTDFYTYGEKIDDTVGDYALAVNQLIERKNAAVVSYVCSHLQDQCDNIQGYIDMLTAEKMPVYIYHNSDSLRDNFDLENVVCFEYSNLKSGTVLVSSGNRLCTHNDELTVRNGDIVDKKYIHLKYKVPLFCLINARKFYV
jgi:hypothetical protein